MLLLLLLSSPGGRGQELTGEEAGTEQGGVRPDPAASRLSVTRGLRGAVGVRCQLWSLTGPPAAIGWGRDLPCAPSGLKLVSGTRLVAARLPLPRALQGRGYCAGRWAPGWGPARIPHFGYQGPVSGQRGRTWLGETRVQTGWSQCSPPSPASWQAAPPGTGPLRGRHHHRQGHSGHTSRDPAALPGAGGGAGLRRKRNQVA